MSPDEALTWCYGQTFTRHYDVSAACKERRPRSLLGPPTRHEHAAESLTRGEQVGKADRHEFRANVAAMGLVTADAAGMSARLFDEWDTDRSGYLERSEALRGVRLLEAALGEAG